jgi:phage portal protein BeeE
MKFKNNGLGWMGKKKDEEQRDNTVSYYHFGGESLPFTAIQNQYAAMNISAVYRAVEIISDSVAMLPIRIK